MTFNESKVARDRVGKFAEKTGSRPTPSVELQHWPSEEIAALVQEHYGITLDDIPADHNGHTIAQRWSELNALIGENPEKMPEDVVHEHLKDIDFGRHRGTWIAFRDDNEDIEEWNEVNVPSSEWGDREVVAVIHTRNGGGNRECWCESEDDHHCLTGVIEEMENHPAYITDRDNSDDRTYADFVFRVPRDLIAHAVDMKPLALAQRRALNTVEAIREERLAPWAVLDENPDTAAEVERLREEAKELAVLPPLPRHLTGQGTPLQKRDSLDRSLRILEGKKVKEEKGWARHPWSGSDPGLMASSYMDSIQTRKPAHQAYLAAKKELDNPELSPHLRFALDKAVNGGLGLEYESKRYREAQANRKALREKLTGLREELSVYTDRLDKAAELRKRADALSKDRYWPSSETAPPQLLTPVEDDDMPW